MCSGSEPGICLFWERGWRFGGHFSVCFGGSSEHAKNVELAQGNISRYAPSPGTYLEKHRPQALDSGHMKKARGETSLSTRTQVPMARRRTSGCHPGHDKDHKPKQPSESTEEPHHGNKGAYEDLWQQTPPNPFLHWNLGK